MTGIHPSAVVDPGAELGQNVEIGPFCVVGPQVRLGDNVTLHAHVQVIGDTHIGAGCTVHGGAILGGLPQFLKQSEGRKALRIGENCTIREHVTMHCGSPVDAGVTTVGKNGFFMAGSHIAHDCVVGDHVSLANGAMLAGHCKAGDYVVFGGASAVHQFTRIGSYAMIGGGSILVDDVIPFGSTIGNRAHLAGLNAVGMKRRGFSREDMQAVRRLVSDLFEGEGMFADRRARVEARHQGNPATDLILAFLKEDAKRSLCAPGRQR